MADAGWKAQWIWAEEADAGMVLARTVFALKEEPQSAHLRITATSVYKLYVNGEYIARGPARSAPHNQSYDTFDVQHLLRQGSNSIAVRVHYQEGTVSHHLPGRGGLLAQLDVFKGDEPFTVATGNAWKLLPDPSWNPASPKMSRFHLELCDRVDLRKSPGNWTGVAFDDASWPAAKVLVRTVGWPGQQDDARATALTLPWIHLEERDIPYLVERDIPATKLIQAHPLDAADSGPKRLIRNMPLTGEVDDDYAEGCDVGGWFLLYDFGRVVNGLPILDIEGPAGTVVDVMCAPYIVDETFTANIVDSQLVDRITLSGERDQWEATYFKPARYMGIVIREADGPVNLNGAGIHELAYPFELKGSLATPEDPWFEQCWAAAARTIEVCTTDAYTDNYRERRQYVQTAYYAALGNAWIFGDTALQRRYLRQAAQEQEASGMMPAYAPRHGNDFMVILDSNTAWIRGLREYYLYSGDEATVRELLPAARRLMSLLGNYTNAEGLLDNPPWPYWLDHAMQDRRGANLCMNGHYHGALEDFADVLEWLGEPGADAFREQANRLRDAVREQFWNSEKGLFCDALIDSEQSNLFSEHANAMALAMGAATAEQAGIVADKLLRDDDSSFIKRDSGLVMVTPAMAYFLHQGLCRYGYVEESLGLLKRRFNRMLDPETNQTLWEEWWRDGTGRSGEFQKRTRSDAQTESAFPPAFLGEHILGLQFTAPGMSVVEIRVPDCGLKLIEGSVPTPRGSFSVKWNLNTGDLELSIPPGTEAQLLLPGSNTPTIMHQGTHRVEF